jgi:hypothetical protein
MKTDELRRVASIAVAIYCERVQQQTDEDRIRDFTTREAVTIEPEYKLLQKKELSGGLQCVVFCNGD